MIKSPKLHLKENEERHKITFSEKLQQMNIHIAFAVAVHSHESKLTSEEVQMYNKALKELITAVSNPLDQFERRFHGSDEMRRQEDTHESLYTDTDVTLPSRVDSSQDTEPAAGKTVKRSTGSLKLLPSTLLSPPSDLGEACREMITIYEHLKAERVSHQEWERELVERERRVEERERRVEALGRLSGIEEALDSCILSVQQRHQREVRQTQEVLRERVAEIKRLRASFNTLKELNSSMKKQLKELGEHNTKLEKQYKSVHGQLENLQRKYDHGVGEKARVNACAKATECGQPPRRGMTGASSKPTTKGLGGPSSPALLSLLLDWLLDTETFSSVTQHRERTPDPRGLPPGAALTDRCLQMLPLLADQLQRTPPSDPRLLLGVLRLIRRGLEHLDSGTQRVALSCTLRRIGAQVSNYPPPSDDDGGGGDGVLPGSRGNAGPPHKGSALYGSPCLHTRVLSALIALHTVTQADLLAQALGSLRTQLRDEEGRGLFLQYGGLGVLLRHLGASGRGGPRVPVEILMQLSAPSRFMEPFLEACSCVDFFSTISRLLQQPLLDLPTLEKLSILLQKLSTIRKNRRLFERSSLRNLLQEMRRTADPTCAFLHLNLASILLNLK